MLRISTTLVLAVILAALSASTNAAFAENTPFDQANAAYFYGELDEAQELYNQVVENSDPIPTAVWLNLGNVAYQKEKLGTARYFFERALREGSGETHRRAEQNLELTRTALNQKYESQIEKGIVQYDESHSAGYAMFTLFERNLLAWSGAILVLLIVLALGLGTLQNKTAFRTLGKTAFLSLLIPFVIVTILYAGRAVVDATHEFGVVVFSQGQFLEAPDENAPGSPLPEGLRIRILKHNEAGYLKVQRSDGAIGYVPDEQVWSLEQPHTL